MTKGVSINKLGLFCCLAFAAVSTTNAQHEPEPRQLEPIGINQPLYNGSPRTHCLFYCRTTMLLFASAGAWLFTQGRRRRLSLSDYAVPIPDVINQCGRSHGPQVPVRVGVTQDRVQTFGEPEIFGRELPHRA